MNTDFMKAIIDFIQYKDYDEEILRLAKLEYPKDWQYAYNLLIVGKQP